MEDHDMKTKQAHPAKKNAQKSHVLAEKRVSAEKLRPSSDMAKYLRQYGRERPEVVALGCLGIGFVLGWKLKFW